MFDGFKTGTLNAGLNVGRRLIANGNVQGSLSLLREVFAGAIDSARPAVSSGILPQIEKWIVPIAQENAFGERAASSDRFSKIITDLTSEGYADEAVRVLVTAIGLDRANARLVQAAKNAFAQPVSGSSQKTGDIARGLMDVGMQYLKLGAPDGIALMGVAHRVGHMTLPLGDIADTLASMPESRADWTQAAGTDVQVLTDYAYDLRRIRRLNTAVGIGALIPPLLGKSIETTMLDGLESTAGTAHRAAIDAGRGMIAKGYPAHAAELLMATDVVSPKMFWNTLDKVVVGPSPLVSAPAVLRTFTRTVGGAVTDAPLNPAPVKPANESLYFALEGKGARCNEAEWDAKFDLLFNYDSPPPDLLAKVKGKRFDALKNSEATLRIMVDPEGFTLSDGIAARDVKFKDGKMLDPPPRFKLRAPARALGGDPSKAGVSITFSVNRHAIYHFLLPIRLVDRLGNEPCAGPSLDLDLAEVIAGASRPRDALVFIRARGDAWRISWDIKEDRQEAEDSTILSAAKLQQAYKNQGFLNNIASIAQKSAWRRVTEDLTLPNDEALKAFARETTEETVKAGIKLRKILCSDPLLEKLLNRINALPAGSRITFKTDDVVFPWELICMPPAGDNNGASLRDQFWGGRFHIESLLVPKEGQEKMRETPQQPGPLRVSAGYDASIDQEDPWKDEPPGPVERQTRYFDTSFKDRGKRSGDYDEIVKMLKQADPASMIYFYCHGNADALIFDKAKDPITFDVVDGPGYPGWPIIFINACDAGNIDPLSFISFRTELRKKQAAGVLAPSFPIPTLFAAYFGKAVLAGYDKRRPIGEIIFELRRRLLEQNNPLGLWYSIQCPLDITAPET